MPRDGSGNYTLPYPAVVDGTTIESAVHNGTMSDIAVQLNGPVPIIAGGTGANNAHDAMIALSGEIAKQIVTNYDSFPFEAGSFYSDAGATAAPNGQPFSGICYKYATNNYMVLEARELLDGGVIGKLFVRQKGSGIWGAWTEQSGSVADLDARYVNLTGDTMTGNLNINAASNPALNLFEGGTLVTNLSGGLLNSFHDWTGALHFRSITGGYTTNISLSPSQVSIPLATASTSPATGALTVAGGVGVGGAVNANAGGSFGGGFASSTMFFRGSSGTSGGFEHQWQKDGTTQWFTGYASKILANASDDLLWYHAALGETLRVKGAGPGGVAIAQATASTSTATGALTVAGGVGVGGALNVAGDIKGRDIYAARDATTGYAFFGTDTTSYLGNDGVRFLFNGEYVQILNATASSSTTTGALVVGGGVGVVGDISARGLNAERGDGSYQYKLTYPGTRQWGIAIESVAGAFCIDDLTGAQRKFIVTTGGITSTNGYLSRAGTPGGNGTVAFNLNWNGSTAFHLWADATNLGNISVTSDYRIKKDVIDLPGMWNTVKALRPIKYTQAQFTPPSHIEYKVKAAAEEAKVQRKLAEDSGKTYEAKPAEEIQPLFPADDIERWGFIAHELQGTLLPTAAEGVKDAPDTIQSINLAPVVAALTKALQEAMTRIEALEAR